MNTTTQALITLALLAVVYFIIRRIERKVNISELQHGQEIEVRSGGKWFAARYYCKMPFKKDHKVMIRNQIAVVKESDIRLVKQSKPMKVK